MRSELIIGVLAAALVCASCSGRESKPTIKEIRQSPEVFVGRTVTLTGVSAAALKLPFVNIQGFQLQDETGESILVQTVDNPPGPGVKVVVRGKLDAVAVAGPVVVGLHLKELDRRQPYSFWNWN